MSKIAKKKIKTRLRRKHHIRKRIHGTPERPRLSVFRSLQHIYVQVIDDEKGHTLVSASTLDPELRDQLKGKTKKEQAKLVGLTIAKRCLDKEIRKISFDRNGFIYHGRIASVAEGAREGGLEF